MSSYDIELAEALEVIDFDDFTMGFRDRYGTHRVGRYEEDPEMLEYEELLSLGMSLGGRAD